MSKLSLLKEYVKLVLEDGAQGVSPPVVITGPVKKASRDRMSGLNTFAILRDFSVVLPPEAMAAMQVSPDELVDGALPGQHEVIIDAEVRHQQGSRGGGNLIDPPTPDMFDIDEWNVVAIDGFELTAEDAEALRAHLGELTRDEVAAIEQEFFEKGGAEEAPDSSY